MLRLPTSTCLPVEIQFSVMVNEIKEWEVMPMRIIFSLILFFFIAIFIYIKNKTNIEMKINLSFTLKMQFHRLELGDFLMPSLFANNKGEPKLSL